METSAGQGTPGHHRVMRERGNIKVPVVPMTRAEQEEWRREMALMNFEFDRELEEKGELKSVTLAELKAIVPERLEAEVDNEGSTYTESRF